MIVAPGCRVTNDDFVLEGAVDLYADVKHISYEPIDLVQQLHKLGIPDKVTELGLHQMELVGSDKGLNVKDLVAKYSHERTWGTFDFIAKIFVTVFSVSLLVSAVLCWFFGCPSCLKPSRRRTIPAGELVMMNAPPPYPSA